jgi:hypothetical protein
MIFYYVDVEKKTLYSAAPGGGHVTDCDGQKASLVTERSFVRSGRAHDLAISARNHEMNERALRCWGRSVGHDT